jgi:hydroxyacylglutathione hydrolase
MPMQLVPVPAFSDNYIWLLINDTRKTAVIVDPGEAAGVMQYIKDEEIRPTAILVTHHHWDHTGGVNVLADAYDLPVYGPASENIAGIDIPLAGDDTFAIDELGIGFDVLDIGGHTAGHIGYLAGNILFCGDTLFSAGCGRIFDGTAQQLHASLQRIASLPDETLICCAHEYTLDNLRFAAAVEPGNTAIQQREQEVRQLRQQNRPSLPVKLGDEKCYNPFLRTSLDTVRDAVAAHCGMEILDDETCFRYLRMWKDSF